jgi:hypothetical protein
MGQIPKYEIIGEVEDLLSELRAIRYWDTEFCRRSSPDWSDSAAFVSRQKRRREIIRKLLTVSEGTA